MDFSMIPSAMPPPGVTPNFDNPYSLALLPRAFIYATLPPMVVFLALRFYTRVAISRSLGVDDWLSAIAAAMMIAYCGVMLTFLDNPAGPHMWDVPLSKLTVAYASRSTILSAVYMLAAMFIKASILFLYWRLFQTSRVANVMIWIALVVNVLFYLVAFIVFMAGCIPRSDEYAVGGWLSLQLADRCSRVSGPVTGVSGIVGSVLDVYILVIPLLPVSGLHASWRRKVGISAIFIAGSSACVFSIVGTVFRMKIVNSAGSDITYTGMPIYAMNIGEINLGIVSASMPVIFPLFRGLGKKSLTWISKLRYASLGGGRKPSQPSGASDVPMLRYDQIDEGQLPQIPKGTMTGLRRWMRNKDRTAPVPETQTALTAHSVLTYVSADYDYHGQLKAGAFGPPSAVSVQREVVVSAVRTDTPGSSPPHSRGDIVQKSWNSMV